MQKTINVNGHKITLRVHRKNGGFIHGRAVDNRGHVLTTPSLHGPTLQDAMDALFARFVNLYADK